MKHKGLMNSLMIFIAIRMCAFYLPETWISPQISIYLEMACIILIAIAFMGFVFRLLEVEALLEEYLTYLQDIYFQIINQNVQILEASERRMAREEVELNRQIIMAENRLGEIVIDAITALRALKTYGLLYSVCLLLVSVFAFDVRNIGSQELVICMLDISLGCLLWMTFKEQNYGMWHLPTIIKFIRGQTLIRQRQLA